MNKSCAGLLAIMLYCAGGVARADQHPLNPGNFSGTVTLTTDYIYRGISFSNEDPALQGSFDWSYGSFFAGAWGSSTTGESYELELNYYFGYADSFAGFDWSVQPIYYHFPGKDSTVEQDTFGGQPEAFEVAFNAARTLAIGGELAPTVSLVYAWMPEYFWDSGDSHYIRGNLALTLPGDFGIDAGVGYQDVEGDTGDHRSFLNPDTRMRENRDYPGFSYTHWDIGISTSRLGFDFDLRYHDTDYDEGGNLYDARVVFSVSRSF